MWNKQQVTSGEYVGEYGVIFLQDLPSKRSPQNRTYRFSKFICPVCNQEFEALFDNVKRGKTKGCGQHISYGEEEIINILQSNNINFISHYNNNDCINPKTGWPLFFDFYLPDYNCYIEYDGIQHFEYHEGSCWNDKNNFFKNPTMR